MQDRPTYDELLAAVEQFLDTEIVPNVPGSRGFHARIAANAIRIVRRELGAEEAQLAAEWATLDELLGPAEAPGRRAELRAALKQRNEQLCALIRYEATPEETIGAIRRSLRATVRDKISVSDPELLARSDAPRP